MVYRYIQPQTDQRGNYDLFHDQINHEKHKHGAWRPEDGQTQPRWPIIMISP